MVFFGEGNVILGHANQDVSSGNTKSMAEDDISKVSLGHYIWFWCLMPMENKNLNKCKERLLGSSGVLRSFLTNGGRGNLGLFSPGKMKVDRGYGFSLKIPRTQTAVRENYLNPYVTKLSLEIRHRLLAIETNRSRNSFPMGTAGTRKAQALLRCKFICEEIAAAFKEGKAQAWWLLDPHWESTTVSDSERCFCVPVVPSAHLAHLDLCTEFWPNLWAQCRFQSSGGDTQIYVRANFAKSTRNWCFHK